jgi:hypothetical protein
MAHFQGRTTPGGLVRVIGPQAARRQLHLSLGLLGILAVASAGAALGLRPGPVDLTHARHTVQAPQMVHVQHAGNVMGE